MSPSQPSLPAEILLQIANLVAYEHRPSLSSFSLVSQSFHGAARPLILHTITLDVLGPRKLREEIDKANSILGVGRGLECVRCLVVDGHMGSEEDEPDEAEPWELNNENYYGNDEIHGPDLYGNEVFFDDDPLISDEEDRHWSPLATFLGRARFLNDLIWKLESQFPPCLLATLHAQLPSCKLHIYKFRFRTLHDATTDPHEIALATSPSLHAIGIRFSWRDSKAVDDHNEEASLQMISSMAPNLKSVTFVKCRPASSPELYNSRERPRQPWQGFKPAQADSGQGKLSSLSFRGYSMDDKLANIRVVTNFQYLRRLHMEWHLTDTAIHALQDAAGDMSSLEELDIGLVRHKRSMPDDADADDVISFLWSLPPLQTLRLSGRVEFSIFSAAIERHGPTLRSLTVSPDHESYETNDTEAAGLKYVRLLESHCQLLENLKISVKRYKSSLRETTVYRSIGKLAQLEHLFLTLECSNTAIRDRDPTQKDPTFDEFDLQPFGHDYGVGERLLNGHLRDAFLNSAVDEQLARSIFQVITSEHPQSKSQLRTLRLTTVRGHDFGWNSFQMDVADIVQHLSRSYLLERGPRDDRSEILVQELGKRAREARDKNRRDQESELARRGIRVKVPMSQQIFRRIWPGASEEVSDWRDTWKSIPLQLSSESSSSF